MAEVKISTKMKKAIKLIEQNSPVRFTGTTFEEAKKFLDENLSSLEGVDFRANRKPSEKQMKGISLVESKLNIKFTGKSMKDASEFLNEHLEKALAGVNTSKKKK